MKRCAFLTMDDISDFQCYDHLLVEPMAALDWQVEDVPWRTETTNWNNYEAVIVRSPWDYQDDAERFLQVIRKIDQSSAHLENSRDLIKWNLNKKYLAYLQKKGIGIVPTFWANSFSKNKVSELFYRWKTDKMIIKPQVSANADGTYRLAAGKFPDKIATTFANRAFMIQPFMKNITEEGEFSLFYFDGRYSHAILKTPQPGDFRVQEEHGGRLKSIAPEPSLLSAADQSLQALPEQPLYARIDFVRSHTDATMFYLMEVELIEPSLYFNMDPGSPQRFARAFDRRMQQKNTS